MKTYIVCVCVCGGGGGGGVIRSTSPHQMLLMSNHIIVEK